MNLSKQIGLLHDSDELLLADFPIPVPVSLVNHLLELIISHSLSQLPRHSLQIFQTYFPRVVVVKKPESLEDLFSGVSFANFSGHKFHEVCELDNSLSISVDFGNQLFNFLLFGLKSESSHCDLEFLGINVSWNKWLVTDRFCVKKIKCLLDLLFLFFSELVSGFSGRF